MTLIEEPRPDNLVLSPAKQSGLAEQMKRGLDAPICLTWELTYACNLQCVHCLSSSGRRDPRELTTEECEAVIDELQRMQVFYINIGGGEPTIRKDFWHLVRYAVDHGVGVKFSTNGSGIDAEVAEQLAESDYVDVQISIDGADADTNDHVRGKVRSPRPFRRWSTSGCRVRGFQDLGGDDPPQHPAGRRVQGDGRPLRCPASTDPLSPVGPWRRLVGSAPSHRPTAT